MTSCWLQFINYSLLIQTQLNKTSCTIELTIINRDYTVYLNSNSKVYNLLVIKHRRPNRHLEAHARMSQASFPLTCSDSSAPPPTYSSRSNSIHTPARHRPSAHISTKTRSPWSPIHSRIGSFISALVTRQRCVGQLGAWLQAVCV